MFKNVKHARNLALMMLIFWIAFDFAGIYSLSMAGAVSTGVVLLVFQFIVHQFGTQMVQNNKNVKNSDLKNALIVAGLPLGERMNEATVRKAYGGHNAKILLLTPAAALAFTCSKVAFSIEPVVFASIFLSAAFFMAMYPIYMASNAEAQASSEKVAESK